jgi:hypothetical protein
LARGIEVGKFLTGEYPAILALKGGGKGYNIKGYNIKETPCRKAPPFRAEL